MESNLLTELFDDYQNNESALINLPSDPVVVRKLFFNDIKGAIFESLQQGDSEKAKKFLAFSNSIADQTNNPEHHALVAWCHTTLHFNRNISEAVKYLEIVRKFYADTGQRILEGRVLVGYASQLSQIGRLEEAEQAILRARECLLESEEYQDWPILYLNLACVQFYQARYEQMLASAQQSESVAKNSAQLHPERAEYYKYWMTQAIINQALAALFLGQIEDGERRLDEALELSILHEWTETAGRARLNLARNYTFQGNFFAALEALRQAEKDFKSVQIDMELATVLLCQADIYKRLMMPLQARNAAIQAAKILSHSNVVAEGIEAYLLATQVSLDCREAKRARRYLEVSEPLMSQASPLLKAIRQSYVAHRILNSDPSALENALQQVEQAHETLKSLGAIAQMLNAALIAADLATHLDKPDVIKRYQAIIEQSQVHALIDSEQQAHMKLGAYYATSLSYGQAQTHLQSAANILAVKREQMPVEELKAALIGGSTDIYTQLIEISLFNEETNSALDALIEAKGGIWLDLLSPAMPVSMPAEWTQARAELTSWQQEARGTTEPAHMKLCEERINHAQKTLAKIAHTQQRKRAMQTLPSYADIQTRLAPTQIILDYLIGSQKIWCCVISRQEVQWLDLGPKQDVERNMSRLNMLFKNVLYIPEKPDSTVKNQLDSVAETRLNTTKEQITTIQQTLSQLYRLLIEPIHLQIEADKLISELLVIPDNYLFELPWTALYDGTLYLGEQYDLALYPSSALLALDDMFHQDSYQQHHQEIGPPYILGYQGNPPLQHLENSLDAIQNIYPTACKINPAQTTDLKWDQVPLWLHIGAHGHVNRRTPLFSQLDLADGPLLLADIFNLSLHGCDLVTLSACETGTTPEQGGVLLALAGSFLCAGAKNVIASLWPVDDEATTILMRSFYKAYNTGITPQQALCTAQQTLRMAGYEHPFYWAAFQVFARAK